MHKNNDVNQDRVAAPNYEAMYEEAVAKGRDLFEKKEALEARCRALEVDSMKYKTIIATMEFLLGRKLDV